MDVCDWLSNNRAGVSFVQMNNWTNLVIFSTSLIWSNHIELEWEYLMEYTSLLHSSLSQNCLLLELASVYTTEKQCQLPSGGIPRKVLEDLGMHTSCSESKITMKSFLLLEYCVVLCLWEGGRDNIVDLTFHCPLQWRVRTVSTMLCTLVAGGTRKRHSNKPIKEYKVSLRESRGCSWTSPIYSHQDFTLSSPIPDHKY